MKPEDVKEPIVEQKAPEAQDQEEINWKKFREEREKSRKEALENKRRAEEAEMRAREKEEEAKALKAAMEAALSKREREQEEDEPSEDDRITRKVEAMLQERERRYQEERQREELQKTPERLHSAFPDFTKVCTTENLDYLEFHYPEVAKAYNYMPEGFEKWASIYKAVKRFVPNHDEATQKKIAQNLQKPQSASVQGTTRTGDSAPVMLDEKRREANWRRMQSIIKGVG